MKHHSRITAQATLLTILLSAGLASAQPRPTSVSLKQWERFAGPSRTTTVDRRSGKALLAYSLSDGRSWKLPSARLARRERRSIKKGVRALRTERVRLSLLDIFEARPSPIRYTGGAELVVADSSRSKTYGAVFVPGLPLETQDLARTLEGILDRVFAYTPRVLTGAVEGQRIRCGRLLVSVRDPLAPLLETLDGERVVVQALVNRDGTWATALHLLAHDSAGRVLPVQAKGPTPGTVISPKPYVVPELPSTLERLASDKQIFSLAEVDLRWSSSAANAVADTNVSGSPSSGILGGLRRN